MSENLELTFGSLIHHFRLQRGFGSARHLSQECGLSPSYVSKMERDEVKPSVESLAKLALVLRLNAQEVCALVAVSHKKDDSSVIL